MRHFEFQPDRIHREKIPRRASAAIYVVCDDFPCLEGGFVGCGMEIEELGRIGPR